MSGADACQHNRHYAGTFIFFLHEAEKDISACCLIQGICQISMRFHSLLKGRGDGNVNVGNELKTRVCEFHFLLPCEATKHISHVVVSVLKKCSQLLNYFIQQERLRLNANTVAM